MKLLHKPRNLLEIVAIVAIPRDNEIGFSLRDATHEGIAVALGQDMHKAGSHL